MVSTKDTIDVSVESYSNAVPDWFEGDTVPIEVTAFSDKIYLDFPSFYRVENKAKRMYLNEDTMLHGDADHLPLDRSEITTFEDALDLHLSNKDDGRAHVPSNTSQFCMSASSVFKATIRVTNSGRASHSSSVDKQSESNRGSLEVEPCLRRMNVLRAKDGDFVHGEPSDVTTTILGNRQENAPAHLKLVEEFCTTIGGFQDDEYWTGYKRAANKFGDERYEWDDVAWDVFGDRWNGNQDLMLEVGKWMAQEGYAVCSRSNALFPVPEWTTPTGSYVATISDVYQGKCPECGADKSEHWECIKSSNRTRVPDTYKCQDCGATRKGITTG